jgi:protein ImuA
MPAALLPDTLESLRRTVAGIQGLGDISQDNQSVSLGVPKLDAALGGGLPRATLHDLIPAAPLCLGAAMGFGLSLAIRASESLGTRAAKPLLWLQTDFARHEAGALYGPGFERFGLPMERLIVLRVPRAIDALWAMEEALRCGAVGSVITELTNDDADLTATRRLALAARDSGGIGFLLRHRSCIGLSAATTRWEIAGAPGARDAYGGFGATTFLLDLVKNRRGTCGRWNISWDHHARTFTPAVSLSVAATARDRSDRARRLTRAG